MKKITNWIRGLAFLLLTFLLWMGGDADVQAAAASQPAGYVTLTVEKFTIGQGFLIGPSKVPFYAGENYAQVLDRVLAENNYGHGYTGSLINSYYLSSIGNGDSGVVRIPAVIRNMGAAVDSSGSQIAPPNSNAINDDFPNLGEFAYSNMSGWMYSVNGFFPSSDVSSYRANEGDLVRFQFTVHGYGADLGSADGGAGVNALVLADKSQLMKKVAEINADKESWFAVDGVEAAYENAMVILETLDARQARVDAALAQLNAQEVIAPEAVSLEPQESQLEVSQTLALQPVFEPANVNQTRVSYTSDNPEVAEVSPEGIVTARKAGQANVTVTTVNGLTAVCQVTVSKPPVPMTGISPKDMSIGVGTATKLQVAPQPEDADAAYTLTYQSSDPSIVEISPEGILNGKKDGTAQITVTATLEDNTQFTATCTVTVARNAEAIAAPLADVLKQTRDYIFTTDPSPDMASQWHIIGLARGGFLTDAYKDKFYSNAAAYIREKKGVLNKNKYSDYSKMILAMTAIGKDARNIEGYNLLEKLADFEKVKKQGINGPIWAMIAFHSHPSYKIPTVSGVKEQTTEAGLIEYVLAREISGGGWTLMGTVADVDMTAMALQALSPYYQKSGYENVTAAIDRALAWLSEAQMADGGFYTLSSQGGTVANAESTCQALTAFSALGIDCGEDSRFIKGGKWTVNALLSYRKDGGFMHIKEGGADNGGAAAGQVNGMATEQAFYSLVAYQRMLNGQSALYDMSDVNLAPGQNVKPNKPVELKGKLNLKTSGATASSVGLKWSKITGAAGYKVYRYVASSKKYKEIARLKADKTAFTCEKLSAGTSYKFRVAAYVTENKKAVDKKTENITASTKPARPTVKAVRKTAKKARISWNKAKGSGGYEIYMSTRKNSGYKKVKTISSGKKGSYTKSGLKQKKTYYFKVRAYKKVNGQKQYGAFSAVKTVKPVKKR